MSWNGGTYQYELWDEKERKWKDEKRRNDLAYNVNGPEWSKLYVKQT